MKKLLLVTSVILGCISFVACNNDDEFGKGERFDKSASKNGLFICNEGNFQYGNATLSYYDSESKEVENEIFYRANVMKLGDVAQSMTVRGKTGWVVVNNSHVVFAIDMNTFVEIGRITGVTSPYQIHFVSEEKAYITQLWSNRIAIVNPKRFEVTGYITCPGMETGTGSTEQMVQYGKYVYVNCRSYQNSIVRIDTTTDRIVNELTVGVQPTSLVLDCNNKLWTVTDGGYEGSPYGYEVPTLYRIDAESLTIEKEFKFNLGDYPSKLQLNGTKDRLYWINNDIWQMDVTAENVPAQPFLPCGYARYYGLTVSPHNGDVYVSDAVDYMQQGVVYRYSKEGVLVDQFYAGIIPGAFCWK